VSVIPKGCSSQYRKELRRQPDETAQLRADPYWVMQRQSAWGLVVFGCLRDVQAVGLVCSGVGRVLLDQRRPPGGGCRSWPIQHLVLVVAGAGWLSPPTLVGRPATPAGRGQVGYRPAQCADHPTRGCSRMGCSPCASTGGGCDPSRRLARARAVDAGRSGLSRWTLPVICTCWLHSIYLCTPCHQVASTECHMGTTSATSWRYDAGRQGITPPSTPQ
jgi:hypothetical protein